MMFSDVKVITISESHCEPKILQFILTKITNTFFNNCQICGIAVGVLTKTTYGWTCSFLSAII